MSLTAAALISYFVWFALIAAVAWRELANRPYRGYRMANQTLRMSIGLTLWPMFTISACAQSFVRCMLRHAQ
jgi:hypothetical protein